MSIENYVAIDREELKRLQADAERYRYLRNYAYGEMECGEICGLFGYNNDIIDEKVDEMITARQEGKRHG